MTQTILIVDDDPVQRRLLENAVNKMGYRAMMANDGEAALEILSSPGGSAIALVVLDLVMPGLDGMGVLERLPGIGFTKPVLVQTAQGGIDTVVGAVRAGAVDFCVKPVSFERLKVSLQNALKLGEMENAVRRVQKSKAGSFTFDDMIAASEPMERVINLGLRAADSKIPVLLEGESGVGKELVARAIQGSGARRGKPFVAVNCGALPENLVESILFGHEKGAFTGASSNHTGKFKEADGGTLFLDEVGELPSNVQVKLLRAIQEGEIDPVGAKRPVKTDFRLISATNRDMIEMVRSGTFREDLYYRLNVFPIMLPPLRRRKEDIPALIRHFTARICLEEGRRAIRGIRNDALSLLEAYDWPGNIRQLENTIFRAIILCQGEELVIDDFPQIVAGLSDEADVISGDNNSIVRFDNFSERASAGSGGFAEGEAVPFLDTTGNLQPLDHVEEALIRFAINHHKGRMTRVARDLGIGRSTLYRKLKEFGINPNLSNDGQSAA